MSQSPINKEYMLKLEKSKSLVISCQKCDHGWIYFDGFNDFKTQMRDVKKHMKTHGVNLK